MGIVNSKSEVNKVKQEIITDANEIKIGKQDFISQNIGKFKDFYQIGKLIA
jgi:hypothetical protein